MYNLLKVIILLVFVQISFTSPEIYHHRQKRYLLFPFQGTFKTVFSFAIPWKLGPKQEMGVGWNLQFQYPLPYNTTVISNYPATLSRNSRNKRDVSDRLMFYKEVESLLERNGLNGKECLMKLICENSNLIHSEDDQDLFSKILQVFLMPKSEQGTETYMEARNAGEYGVDCSSLYSGCQSNNELFNIFFNQ